MTTLHGLLGAIGVAPALPGARCRGKSHLFDEAGPHESPEVAQQRHNQAVGLCQHCPSLPACETWYAGLRSDKRPTGVVAGRVRGARRGRPPATPPHADDHTQGKTAS